MGKCVVVCAGEPCRLDKLPGFSVGEGDFVICADGGLDFALAHGLPVHLVVGDFDSSACTQGQAKALGLPVYEVPSEKDDTDTMLAVKLGLERGYREFALLCALGGRLDHTLANLCALAYLKGQGASGWLYGRNEQVTLLENETLELPAARFYGQGDTPAMLSVFAYTEACRGVTLEKVKYPLQNYTLTQRFPLGVSNELAGESARVTAGQGQLLVMLVQEDRRN